MKHNITISHHYAVSPKAIYQLIQNGTLFSLTGADSVTFDFRENGPFRLRFSGRGQIDGKFRYISDKQVILLWNAEGFDLPPEVNTKVCISFSGKDGAVVTIEHSEIGSEEGAAAKKKAWTELLNNLEKYN